MPRLYDPAVDALISIIYRRLGEGVSPISAPALCKTWLRDFRDTIQDQTMRPINTLYRAHPFRGKTVFEGQSSYPLFALWRDSSDWKNFTADTDENMSIFSFMWVLPPEKETERMWPLLQHFISNLRRVLENAPEDPEDATLLLLNDGPHNEPNRMALISEYGVEIKSRFVFQGPGEQLLYPTLVGTFAVKQNWERNVHNLGLRLERFREAFINYHLKDPRNDGDWSPAINPILESYGLPLQP